MQIDEAIHLLEGAFANKNDPEVWADLGCGNGVFTQAMADVLPANSLIYAIDKVAQNLPQYRAGVEIKFALQDFEKHKIQLPLLNGILMANSLHFVSNKERFVDQLINYLFPAGVFVIVEYDMVKNNPWVPFPVSFDLLKMLFFDKGFKKITKLAERRSVYNRSNIYASLIERE